MKVDLLDSAMVNSDLGVVNAARCSFDKESWYQHKGDLQECVTDKDGRCVERGHNSLSTADAKLITYLATHNHWTPFAHAQEVFDIDIEEVELTYFLLNANLSGFEWCRPVNSWTVRGSLYAWLTNSTWLPEDASVCVRTYIYNKYPVSYVALRGTSITPMLTGKHLYKCAQHIPFPTEDENRSYTLHIHAPIFVKRQLETHRRNFVMTDIEDFAQNEVSRRYVDSEPEFYTPKEWRIQAKDKKQGSSEETLEGIYRTVTGQYYNTHLYQSLAYYEVFNKYGIAHEQSRMVLPLSTYTTWWWTGSVKSWKRMAALRLDEHAQGETRELAQLICDAIPVSLT